MIELKNRLSHARIIVTLNEKLIKTYDLDQNGQPTELLNLPDSSRVLILGKKENVLMDGRVRGNMFRPAKRLRPTLGKQFPLGEMI